MKLEQGSTGQEKADKAEREQQQLAMESLYKELVILPAAFGAGYAAVTSPSESLNRRVLQTIPEERTGLVKWWRENSSMAQREVFAAQESAVSRYLGNVEIAKGLDARATTDFTRNLQELLPHTKALEVQTRAFAEANTSVISAESRSLEAMATSPKNFALAETKKFLTGPNLAIHNPGTIALVEAHQKALQSGIREIAESSTNRFLLKIHANDLAAYASNPSHRQYDLNWMRQQHATLTRLAEGKIGGQDLLNTVGVNNMEMGAGEKLFIRGTKLGDLVEVTAKQLIEKEMTVGELAANKAALTRELEQSSRVFAQANHSAGTNFLRALGVAGFSTAAGYNFDRALAHALNRERPDDRADENAARLAVDGCLVPAFILSDIPMKFRVPLVITAFGAGRIGSFVNADNTLSPELAKLLKPNQADTFLMGAAIMAPLGARYKAMGIVGALAAGRVVNLF
ncbi:MAG: hypothetical protein K2W95_10475 [Candidatus Obscuribacterales bacterium]|nr:hypothetical protein [Candidatus Obscuribacterales bacterium]